jgi:large subunit ribosomal protein L17
MRHRVRGRKLGRTASHREALLRSLATSLFKYKRIRTTVAKAKEARSYTEALITKARKGDLHSQRQVMGVINDKEVVKELFGEIIPKIGDRPGGYTRIVKLGNRMGDAAELAILELVDYNDVVNAKAEDHKEKKEAKIKAKKEKEAEEKETEETEQEEIEEAKVVSETENKE